METTSGLGLKLPSDSDYYDIEDMNYNTRKIDQEFQKSINSEHGMYGIRYYDGKLEVKDNGEWKKVPAHMEDMFGKPYLTEEDWMISL